MCEIIAVTSGNGGSGKTMFAANFASVLAMSGCRVLLMDLNTGLRNLDIALGLENQIVYDIADVVKGICALDKALIRDSRFNALYLLSASQDPFKAGLRTADMEQICRILSARFDFIIIDTPAGLGRDWRVAVSQAGIAIVLMTQEYSSIRETEAVDLNLQRCGIRKRYAVINRLRRADCDRDCFPRLEEIDEALHMPIVGGVIFDENVHLSMNSSVPVVCRKDSYIVRNFKRIFLRIYNDRNNSENRENVE